MSAFTHGTKRGNNTANDNPSSFLSNIACKRCRRKKVKCDGEYPSCSGCVKADVACIVADWSAPRDYTRQEVRDLENKLQSLQDILSTIGSGAGEGNNVQNVPSASPIDETSSSDQFESTANYQSVFESMHEYYQSQPQISCSHSQNSSIVYHPPHQLPAQETASIIIDEYFREFHVAHPFLDKAHIVNMMHSHIYPMSQPPPAKHDLFIFYMALAIGSINLYRNGTIALHPFGFFTAALEAQPPSESSFNSIEDLEMFLLISHFGVYYNIGCSLWELGWLCARIAIELGLHLRRHGRDSSCAIQTQREIIVFWNVYLLDRLSSSTLNRPFAIDDSVISADLPMLEADKLPANSFIPTTFNHLVRLCQITSRIPCSIYQRDVASQTRNLPFHQGTDHLSTVDLAFSQIRELAADLSRWRKDAQFEGPKCAFETQDFLDFSYQEARLSLIRAAIDMLYPSGSLPSKPLLRSCLQAACSVITTFDRMRESKLVTYTRAYTHLILVSSLVIVLVVNMHLRHHKDDEEECVSIVDVDQWLSELEDTWQQLTLDDALDSLRAASRTLNWFAEEMPDVLMYSQFFEALKSEIEKIATSHVSSQTHILGGRASSPGEPDTPRNAVPSMETSAGPLANPILNVFVVENNPAVQGTNSAIIQPSDDGAGLLGLGVDVNAFFPNLYPSEASQMNEGTRTPTWQDASWPFSFVTGLGGMELGISEHIWDMVPPWEESPSSLTTNQP